MFELGPSTLHSKMRRPCCAIVGRKYEHFSCVEMFLKLQNREGDSLSSALARAKRGWCQEVGVGGSLVKVHGFSGVLLEPDVGVGGATVVFLLFCVGIGFFAAPLSAKFSPPCKSRFFQIATESFEVRICTFVCLLYRRQCIVGNLIL